MTSNVTATSTTGLYGISSNVRVPNSAQQLLNLLYSNGNVNFSLAPGNVLVQANAMVSSSGGGGTYGNSNVAAYLASNTDPTVSNLNANSAVQAVAINTVNANIGAYQTFANANAASQATSINTINANLGAFQTYANVTFGTSSYGNTQATALLANFGSNAISTSGNITGGYFVGNAAALDRTTGVATGTYGSDTTIPTIVVDAKGRITQITTNAVSGGGSYGNSNVAAYLASNTDATISTLNANAAVQAVQINTVNANIGAYQTFANANAATQATSINSINANLGSFQTYANVTFSTVANAASQQTQIDGITNGTTTLANVKSTGGYFWANGTAYSKGSDGTYGNTQVAAFLPVYGGPILANVITATSGSDLTLQAALTKDIRILAASGGASDIFITTTDGEIIIDAASSGGYAATIKSGALINLLAPNVTTNGQFTSTGGYYWANGTPYLGNGGPSYGNANVASFLPTYTGDLGGNLRSGNVYSTGTVLIQSAAAQTVYMASGAGANVFISADGYLNLTGNLGIVINSTPRVNIVDGNLNVYKNTFSNANGYIYADNNITAGGNIISNNYLFANGVSILGSSSTYGNVDVTAFLNGTAPVNYITGTGNNLNLVGGANSTGSGAILQMGAGTIGGFPGPVAYFNNTNVAVASGNISTSYGPTMGTCLYDTVNDRLFINAFPLSTPDSSISNNIYSNFMVVNPVYTNNQLQQPPLANATTGGTTIVSTSSQVVGLVQSSNVALQSGYGFGAQNRNTVGTLVGMTVNPVTANSMNNNDRVRAFTAAVEYQSNIGWGALSSTSQNASSINALSGIVYLNNGSSIGSAVGALTGVIITPPAGLTSNVQYATGSMPFTNLLNTAGTTGKSNVVYSRAVAPFVTGFSSNLTVQYAVGLHTYSGWAGTGTVGSASNPILGRFAVLNEDVNSTIQTNGNVTITGNTSLAAYTESQQDYGNTGGTINFSVYSAAGSVKSLTLTSNLTVNTNNITMPKGGTLTLIITQDGTGSRTLTSNIKFAGGSKTLSTAAGAIDTISIYNDGTNLLGALVKGYA